MNVWSEMKPESFGLGVLRAPVRELVAVVDEDAWSARRVETLVRRLGARVLTFASPLDALRMLPKLAADVLVAQRDMRELDVLELLAHARAAGARRRPGLVLLADDPSVVSAPEVALADAITTRPACDHDLPRALRIARRRRRQDAGGSARTVLQ
ncbi:hypothetical protein [Sandaracinus amylolyticus]|uniref:Response regulatory domain-containing protein n=1 Tax=Sandaracinus amylolyticus TaxID=927083 RepID=A0A0F6YN07_9BACT|nr:hypothetical protein [Sandaracinus amylolyticus]AKF09863.1 hypothetical protein DB32_007012 [Sandaracinus amylolyticus]